MRILSKELLVQCLFGEEVIALDDNGMGAFCEHHTVPDRFHDAAPST